MASNAMNRTSDQKFYYTVVGRGRREAKEPCRDGARSRNEGTPNHN
jgi:hypothetical protein